MSGHGRTEGEDDAARVVDVIVVTGRTPVGMGLASTYPYCPAEVIRAHVEGRVDLWMSMEAELHVGEQREDHLPNAP